jgi:hypothetical protein
MLRGSSSQARLRAVERTAALLGVYALGIGRRDTLAGDVVSTPPPPSAIS